MMLTLHLIAADAFAATFERSLYALIVSNTFRVTFVEPFFNLLLRLTSTYSPSLTLPPSPARKFW